VYKFGRNYELSIGVDVVDRSATNTITIALPFTIEFDITRNVLTSANVCQIKIFNLNEKTRNKIRFNFFNTGEYRPIILKAGYGSGVLPVIFTGNISQAWSVRDGVNFVTTIECYDGGWAFATSKARAQFEAGTITKQQIESLAETMSQYNVSKGAIGDYPNVSTRAASYSGNTMEIINQLSGNGAYIDNGSVHCLGNSECTEGGIALIDASSGLLGTPVLERTLLTFDMLFEPGVIVGQKIKLESLTNSSVNSSSMDSSGKTINGDYKVISIKHRGTISSSICGDAVTSLGMFFGTSELTVFGQNE